MRKFSVFVVAALLAACSNDSQDTNRVIQLKGDLPVAMTVNGVAVPQELVDAFARQRNLDPAKPEQRAQILHVLTDYVLLAGEAQRENLAAKPQFAADVEVARLSALANATMQSLRDQTPLTDEALKAEYDTQVAKAGKQVYDFSQLLFANEDDAIKANSEILGGKSFDKVYDEWKAKAKQAKVFTRVRPEQLPEALAQAFADMKNGEVTKVPVKTEFGFHVARLDVVNPFTPPPFDQVKENIRRVLETKIGEQRLDKLKDEAKIEYPPGSAPLPEQKTGDSAMSAAPAPAKPAETPAPAKPN